MTQQLAEGYQADLRRRARHSNRVAVRRPARRLFAPMARLRAPGATGSLRRAVLATG